jgi:hypothetical protein
MRKTTKCQSNERYCQQRDSNRTPPEYVSRHLPLSSPQRSSDSIGTNRGMKNGVFWLLHHVDFLRNDVSAELSASFIRVTTIGEIGTTLDVTSKRRRCEEITSYLSRWGQPCPLTPYDPDRLWDPPSLQGSESRGLKLTSAEGMKTWISTSTPPYAFMA